MSEQTTLRDQLSAAFEGASGGDQVDTNATATATAGDVGAGAGTGAEGGTEASLAESVQQQFDRERDERGRFAPKGEKVPLEQAQQQAAAAPAPGQKTEAQHRARPQRPTTWKKDVLDKYWDAIDPELAEYLVTREGQYASGVSTYKGEWERVKPISEAMQQFMPLLQQHNIDPATWITGLGNAHRMLAMGTPEQKAFYFQKLARDYGVQLPQGSGQGDPAMAGYVDQLQQLEQRMNHFMGAQQRQEQERVQSEIAKWSAGKAHYEQVRETMARLLESGVATDLDSAYDKAVRLNDEIFQQVQAEQARAREEEQRRQAAEAVSRAKGKAVSVVGTTPVGEKTAPAKGLRAQLEAAAESSLGGARV